MLNILDFEFEEVPIGGGSLPLAVNAGQPELPLTEIWLGVTGINQYIFMYSTVGWQALVGTSTIAPELIFRIRRGGFGTNSPIVFQTSDSALLIGNTAISANIGITTAFNHTELPPMSVIGVAQQYFLTVQNIGVGNATIVGPVNLTGFVLG
ncbi:hypothetical protein [Paenibacillus gorillae]|uniref:hypothetical protein n=1 Tax=Paenibacillus gorillae TaxID=1243662 RepID=UPI0004B67199|nr:hypothetical protein [Paenibacillus gorillae]